MGKKIKPKRFKKNAAKYAVATRVSTYRIPVYFFFIFFFQEVLVLAIFYERAYCPAHIPRCLPDLLLYDLVSSIGFFWGDSFTAHYIIFLCWYFPIKKDLSGCPGILSLVLFILPKSTYFEKKHITQMLTSRFPRVYPACD